MLPPSTSLPVMGEIAGVNTALPGGYLHSSKTRAKWALDSIMNSMATCLTWRRMGSVRLCLAHDPPYDENKQPYHTGSVTAQGNRDRAFCHTPGQRCQAYYWCITEDLWKRHQHRHAEHKDTNSCRETPGTNT